MAAVDWFYAKGTRQFGPVATAELKQLADRGEVTGDDLVWREGMKDWTLARKVKGLFDADLPTAKPPEGMMSKTAEAAPHRSPEAGMPKMAESLPPGRETVTARPLPVRTAPATFEESAAAYERAREGDRFHLFDHLLEAVRKQSAREFVASAARMFALAGHYGLYAAMAALLVFHLTFAGKGGGLPSAVTGLIAVVVLALFQYSASRFSGVLERLNRATFGRVSSTAFLDCFALLSMVAGFALVLGLTLLGVRTASLSWAFPAIAGFIICEYLAVVALNPDTISLTVDPETRVAEEALGVLLFLSKLALCAVPIAFGVGVIWATLRLVWAEASIFLPHSPDASLAETLLAPSGPVGLLDADPKHFAAQQTAFDAVRLLVCSAALPFLMYVLFLCACLAIDTLRALLGKRPSLAEPIGGDKADEE